MTETIPSLHQPGKGADGDARAFRRGLLEWYDKYARVLPWRTPSGRIPDPYHVWLSEVMLQQTTVQAVIPYFGKFVDKWPTVKDIADAQDESVMKEWAGLGYYARARNLLKCARVVAGEHRGVFPDTIEKLKELPGIGEYTAAAISSIAFDKVATVIDGNVDRVVSRWFAIEAPLPDSKPLIREKAKILFESESNRPGDFAQAMMDLGASICTPKNPKCALCPVAESCQARAVGTAAVLPRRKEKKPRPRRAGYVYWITNSCGDVLFERREKKGLLGGMVGLPTSDWVDWDRALQKWPSISHISAIKAGDNASMGNKYRIHHTFTHFDLELRGVRLVVAGNFAHNDQQFWVSPEKIDGLGTPSVFKKFLRLMES